MLVRVAGNLLSMQSKDDYDYALVQMEREVNARRNSMALDTQVEVRLSLTFETEHYMPINTGRPIREKITADSDISNEAPAITVSPRRRKRTVNKPITYDGLLQDTSGESLIKYIRVQVQRLEQKEKLTLVNTAMIEAWQKSPSRWRGFQYIIFWGRRALTEQLT